MLDLRKVHCANYFAESSLRKVLCAHYSVQSNLRKIICAKYFAEATLRKVLCAKDFAGSTLRKVFCAKYFAESTLREGHYIKKQLRLVWRFPYGRILNSKFASQIIRQCSNDHTRIGHSTSF